MGKQSGLPDLLLFAEELISFNSDDSTYVTVFYCSLLYSWRLSRFSVVHIFKNFFVWSYYTDSIQK